MKKINISPIALGGRLRALRKIAKLKRFDLAILANVSKPSITYWEHGQINNPIKSKSMAKILGAFKQVGIIVSERWLRTGEGDLPTQDGKIVMFKEDLLPSSANPITAGAALKPEDITAKIAKIFTAEIKLFAALEQAVILKVEHNDLMPYLNKGDLVGGVWQPSLNAPTESICIFSLNNQLQVACLKKRVEEKEFDINYVNPTQGTTAPTTTSLFLEEVAPVVRVWR